MTVTAQIGATFESMVMGAPIGLVGSIGWELMDPATHNIVISHRTGGISEPSPGTYFTTDVAPPLADQYLMIWDFMGTSASEDLIVQVAPIVNAAKYATVTDVRNYSGDLVAQYTDADINGLLIQAQQWIDWYLPPIPPLASGLKYDPTKMPLNQATQLNYATCAQVEYMFHQGPGFFISGATAISGGDYQEQYAPKLAPKAKRHLLSGYLIRLGGRVSPDYWNRSRGRLGPYTNIPYPIGNWGYW